jgi:hypothetical protein
VLVRRITGSAQQLLFVAATLLLAAALICLSLPNITGFLALTMPIAMSVRSVIGPHLVLCGWLMIAWDAALYYPVQSASSPVIYQRSHLSSRRRFR